MKMYVSAVISLIIALVFATSCQKELEGVLSNDNLSDSTISRIVVLDTTFASGLDTIRIANFFYDSQDRISKFNTVNYTPGINNGSGWLIDENEIEYTYSGVEKTPRKINTKITDHSTATVDDLTTFLEYRDGYVSKDSFVFGGTYRVALFSKLSTSRYVAYHKLEGGPGGQNIDTSYVQLDIQNGNLIKETDSLLSTIGGVASWFVASMAFQYDSKPNPLNVLTIPYPAPYFQHHPGSLGIMNYIPAMSKNNITKVTNGIGTVIGTYTYQYGATGLPKVSKDLQSPYKSLFFYKKL